ncbi:taurine transport system permease protein [Halanaerobium saccharolyticum]|uniref:Taurine transport system permease protein n=1 Tax=Halanaerobium saccharolyticum TaxID=43595 RepID=A0A4R7YRY1_9FIRM|nr:ABC transporter permease subunit [Halanaerobium saccharolyticum]RAK04028.1 taurine transport system permease protein [Halanaerobium saccharolyticum]TDV97593.1 taurine transport system permease protein [Halanaerobium saccharolyticum]TDX49178.1 taurine transport system permease protein [Halanaerobium saccharolyticum]
MALNNKNAEKQDNNSSAQAANQNISRKTAENKKTKTEKALTILTWGSIFLIWYVITRLGIFTPTLLPGPARVWKAFLRILENGYNGVPIWVHLGASFKRLFVAIFFAISTAVPLGLLSGYFDKIEAVLDSVVEFYRPLPPLAYYTLLILWFGIDDTSKQILLFLAAFAPIYIACVSAVRKLNQDFVLSAKSLGANQKDVFLKIVLPASLPEIFTGIRTAFGVAYTTLVSSEMVAATSGIGWMVLDASNFLKSDVIFVGIIIMGITGVIIDAGLRFLERKIIFWKGHI